MNARRNIPPVSMPFTAASETVLSTAFRASLTGSSADLAAGAETEKGALEASVMRGAMRETRALLVEILQRNDIVTGFGLWLEDCYRSIGWLCGLESWRCCVLGGGGSSIQLLRHKWQMAVSRKRESGTGLPQSSSSPGQ